MDWNALQDSMQIGDSDYPARRTRMVALARVLAGEQYDHIETPFSVERTPGGDYIPLDRRRPTVRTGWCRTVVDDSVSMLFGQGRWPCPAMPSKESPTIGALKALVDATQLAGTMAEAATVGSAGSVAILFRVLANRPYFDVFSTAYLTPEWDPAAPRALLRVTEKRKVRRVDLVASGYTALAEGVDSFWFQRQWDAQEEAWFTPWPIADRDHVPRRDPARSAVHGLGVVPMVWIRNLPGGDAVDGACTFTGGIDTEIEADYQLSQGGRGLKYSSDPTLLIKEPAGPLEAPTRIGGAASALIVGGDGDAKLLEISGSAADAVANYVIVITITLRSEVIQVQINGSNAANATLALDTTGPRLISKHSPIILFGAVPTTYPTMNVTAFYEGVGTPTSQTLTASQAYGVAGNTLSEGGNGINHPQSETIATDWQLIGAAALNAP